MIVFDSAELLVPVPDPVDGLLVHGLIQSQFQFVGEMFGIGFVEYV